MKIKPETAEADVYNWSQMKLSSLVIAWAIAQSPSWLCIQLTELSLPGPLLQNFQFLTNMEKAESRRQTIVKFV